MSYIKDFDSNLAFIGPKESLSREDIPNETLEVNEKLSFLIAYLYLATKISLEETMVVRTESYATLKTLLPNNKLIMGENSDTELIGYHLEAIDCADKPQDELLIHRGLLMKPTFVERDSKKVYEIFNTADSDQKVRFGYCLQSLNFFNQVIRNNHSGKGPLYWRDPIADTTKLGSNYDVMFSLYVLDRYLTTIDSSYIESNDPEYRLAKTLSALEVIKEMVERENLSKVAKTSILKDFSSKILRFDGKPVENEVILHEARYNINEVRRNFCDLLYYMINSGLKKESKSVFVLVGFRNYKHLKAIELLFPNCNFEVWQSNLTTVKKSNISYNSESLNRQSAEKYQKSEKYSSRDIYLVSGLQANLQILDFVSPKTALVYFKPLTGKTIPYIFASVYTDPNLPNAGCMIMLKEKFKTKESLTLNKDFKNFVAEIASDWRDTDKWLYKNPITGNDEDNYDNVFLSTYLIQYLKVSGSDEEPKSLRKKVLKILEGK